ncbi:MAG: 50S ribosomal protein L19e [Candidatus Aenigmarchaeota archaeon]|nr:50S ribosomal protein L19e [Candidatus Aenigmarchaeota archaeon]
MDLKSQKNMASKVMKCGKSRVWIDPARIADASDAITLADIRKLISDGVIKKLPEKGQGSFRAKKTASQKKKGRRKGRGSRKGSAKTRLPKKKTWMKKIRAIRKLIKHLKSEGKIDNRSYRDVYVKSKSGFFRSKSHVMIYLERNNLLKDPGKKEEK